MFAVIETNGANHIVIAVPGDTAAKSLPALASMFEKNAVFVSRGYREAKIVKPKMSIVLGDSYEMDGDEPAIVVNMPDSGAVIGEDFAIATPEVFTSNAKAIATRDERIARLQVENQSLRNQLDDAIRKLDALTEINDDTEG